MMADAMEFRDVQMLEKLKEIRPCLAVMKGDETMMLLRNYKLRGKDFHLAWQIIAGRPGVQADFADGR